jgi:hypothetical protein
METSINLLRISRAALRGTHSSPIRFDMSRSLRSAALEMLARAPGGFQNVSS